jgi:Uma2 family endonuclease
MNVQVQVRQDGAPRPLKINVDQFWHLKKTGAFARYDKSELLYGEMSGVPLQSEDEPESDASVPIPLRVEDYLSLDAAGLLPKTVRTELIDGLLYEMSPQYRPHWYIKNELTYRLRRALEDASSPLYAGSEGSVVVSAIDLFEPDIVVTSEPIGSGPIPISSVRLLVEVADTTRSYDLGLKAKIYAAAGLPEYWVVDLPERKVHQFWVPDDAAYAQSHEQRFGERLEAKTLPLAITLPD